MRSAPLVSSDPGAADAVVSLRGAGFGYGDRPVLTDVDLTIRSGEIVAIVGPNGSGKSTLMKGVLGLNERTSGSVSLFGVDSDDFHDRARIGYVPQRHTLSASVRATAAEIVSTGRLARIGWLGRLRAADRQVVARSLEVVGLADRATTEVSTLSGGQQRRVLIARALAAEPDVLIMDEPTAGVDAASQHVLADVLERLVERDVTMVIVTHELGALERLLTRIVVVDGGRIRFDGTPQEYAHARDHVHHDHDSHHHDHELDGHASLAHGPFDTHHPEGRRP
ncbi:MAG: metal ABC transporter ATP-binding protein [Terrabacter sp.]